MESNSWRKRLRKAYGQPNKLHYCKKLNNEVIRFRQLHSKLKIIYRGYGIVTGKITSSGEIWRKNLNDISIFVKYCHRTWCSFCYVTFLWRILSSNSWRLMALPTWAETSFAMASDLAVAIFSWSDILENRYDWLYKTRMSLFYQFLMKIPVRILELIRCGQNVNKFLCFKNKDDISGALFTLNLSLLILNSQRKEGVSYGIFVLFWIFSSNSYRWIIIFDADVSPPVYNEVPGNTAPSRPFWDQ